VVNIKKNGGSGDEESAMALTIIEAARLSGTSRSTIYEALQRRELEGKKLGRRTIILRDALKQYLSSLPAFGEPIDKRGSNNG
jgi:excisionase family DNA binding protein